MNINKIGRNSGLTVSKYVIFHAREAGDNNLAKFLDFMDIFKDV